MTAQKHQGTYLVDTVNTAACRTRQLLREPRLSDLYNLIAHSDRNRGHDYSVTWKDHRRQTKFILTVQYSDCSKLPHWLLQYDSVQGWHPLISMSTNDLMLILGLIVQESAELQVSSLAQRLFKTQATG